MANHGHLLTCSMCEHVFDSRDERAHIPTEGSPYCPACALMTLRGTEAWAVWNDCNGVFVEEIFHFFESASKALTEHRSVGAAIKPIRIYEDPDPVRNSIAEFSQPLVRRG